MKLFKLNNIVAWSKLSATYTYIETEGEDIGIEQVSEGYVYKFEVGLSGKRNIKMRVNTVSDTVIWASHKDDMSDPWLVMSGQGLMATEVATTSDLYVQIVSQDEVYASGTAADHRVSPTTDKKFTNIEMRKNSNSDFERMMMVVKHNDKQRDIRLDNEIKRLNRAAEQKVIDNEDIPKGGDPAPTPPQTKKAPEGDPAKGDDAADPKA